MENETKLRRTHFTIQLRRENNEESFHKARRQMINTRDKIEVENSAVISEMFSQNMMRVKQAENIQELMAALISTRSLMSATNDVGQVPVREFLASGLLDPVMALARGDPSFPERDREVTQVEALWIVSNLVLCPVEFYPKLLALGLLEMVDETLGSEDPNLLKHSLWIISNLVVEDASIFAAFVKRGTFARAVRAIGQFMDYFIIVKSAARMLSNVSRVRDFLPPELEKKFVSVAFEIIRKYKDLEIMSEALWTINFFIDRQDDYNWRVEYVGSLNMESYLIEFLSSPRADINRPAVRILGFLSLAEAKISTKILTPTFFSLLPSLLSSESPSFLTDVLWILTNLVLTDELSHNSLFDDIYLEPIMRIITRPYVQNQSESAVFALTSFIVFASKEDLKVLINDYGVIEVIFRQLNRSDVSKDYIEKCLSFLLSILRFENISGECGVKAHFLNSQIAMNIETIGFENHDKIKELTDNISVELGSR